MTQLSQPNFQQLAQSLIEQLSRHTEQLARLEKTVAELQSQTVSLRTQISVKLVAVLDLSIHILFYPTGVKKK